MRSKPLTKIQQDWLNHIEQATKHKLFMPAYAKQNNLALKIFNNARSALTKNGILPTITNNPLIPVFCVGPSCLRSIIQCFLSVYHFH
ncbi:hypothetical protein [Psychromonas marina]|uniref:hypothetical protein n=1 Tax=Psychromonas marina TaxID=88364 RepID=UPI0024E112E0|nr:hypothetical protein [Psychromonas marina]